jgi:hypothetical protein
MAAEGHIAENPAYHRSSVDNSMGANIMSSEDTIHRTVSRACRTDDLRCKGPGHQVPADP